MSARCATNRDRVLNYEWLRPLIAEKFAHRSRADWLEALGDAGVPAGAVRDVGEVPEMSNCSRDAWSNLWSIRRLAWSRCLAYPSSFRALLAQSPGRRLGWANTPALVLQELGLNSARIAELQQAGVI